MAKAYDELTFTDDFLFCKILSTDLELCRDILKLILNIPIREVRLSEAQRIVEITADARGVRFDVYVEDENDTVFDIEMQTTADPEFPKRSRYYQGMIDLNLIERGTSYKNLRRSYVIFIFLKDPFGYDLPFYTFENTCNEQPELGLGDETFKVAVNASCTKDDLPVGIKNFFSFLLTAQSNDPLTRRIANNVSKATIHKKWRVEYMTLEMKFDEAREEGLARGLAQGQSNILTALQALLEGRDDASILAEGITPDTIDKARKFLKNAIPMMEEYKQ